MCKILFPEYCTIIGGDGASFRGPDQDWFPTSWQRRAGCGPTTAALILAYLAQAKPGMERLWPDMSMEQAAFTAHMCHVWQYVTPRSHGLNRPEWMAEGLADYGTAQGVPLSPALLELPATRSRRPSLQAVEDFVGGSLERDCPVAFLNLCHGKVKELDYWHWVTIAGLEGGRATILDNGREFSIDLALWYETTKKRGGFVSPLGGSV